MPDIVRDISLLVQIARIDAALNDHRVELDHLPGRIAAAERQLAELDAAKEKAENAMEEMAKERRTLEQGLQDDEAKVVKFKTDLMGVGSNKEYTAVLKEISTKEEEIGQKEERLLELMYAMEEGEEKHDGVIKDITARRDAAAVEKKALEERVAFLQADSKKLEAEKPKLLLEVQPSLQRRYERLLENLGGLAVTRVEGESCGGCHTQLPPQLVVEVRQNDQLITCQNCGRILIYYAD
jgi:predicted  nucleic acid-binding Zn-ribbon protein